MVAEKVQEMKPVRLIVRVHILKVSPMAVAEIQEGIRDVVKGYPDAEVETSMMAVLPER